MDAGVFLSYGGNAAAIYLISGSSAGLVNTANWAWSSTTWNTAVTKVTVGDFGGDGKSDVVAFYGYYGERIKIWEFDGTTSGISNPWTVYDSGVGNMGWNKITVF